MQIKLTKQGFRRYEHDCTGWHEMPFSSAITALRDVLVIEDGVTLGDLFNAIDQDVPLKMFIGEYSWCNVDLYHQEAKQPVVDDAHWTPLEYLEVYKYYEFTEDSDEVCHDIHAYGPNEKGDGQHWGICFTPMNRLVDLPIRVAEKASIYEDYKQKREFPSYIRLLDFLDAIYFEISFYGTPEKRDAVVDGLGKAARAIMSGEAQTHSFDDVFGEEDDGA